MSSGYCSDKCYYESEEITGLQILFKAWYSSLNDAQRSFADKIMDEIGDDIIAYEFPKWKKEI